MINRIWDQQKEYNSKVKKLEGTEDKEYWTEKYLIGLVSEINEVLDEIRWKRHRRQDKNSMRVENIGLELADIFKYALCLYDIWDFDLDTMLQIVRQKSDMLDFKLEMEFKPTLKVGTNVAIIDLDGVIADLNKSFADWALQRGFEIVAEDLYRSPKQDKFLLLHYPEYSKLKEEFEQSGGYRDLYAYKDAIDRIHEFCLYDVYIVIVTNRPVSKNKRIFYDTFYWLTNKHIPFNEIHVEEEDRILLADKFIKEGCNVIMFEDNPELIMRAVNSGITVVVRSQPYNEGLTHNLITRISTFEQLHFEDCWSNEIIP